MRQYMENNTLVIAVVACIFSLLYLNTLAVHHSEAEDVLSYAAAVSLNDPLQLFHPNHLLFENASLAFVQFIHLFMPDLETITAMQILQAICGIFSLALLYKLQRDNKVELSPALCTVLTTGVAYGFWAYSVEADTYIIPIPFLLLAIRELLTFTHNNWSPVSSVRMGIYLASATLLHQQYVLTVPAFIVTFFLIPKPPQFQIKRLLTSILLLCAVSGGITLIVYLSVAFYVLDIPDLLGALSWSLGHGSGGLHTSLGFSSLIKAAVGFTKAILGTNFLFGFNWFNDIAALLFDNLAGHEERYLANSLSSAVLYICLFSLLIALIALAFLIIMAIRNHFQAISLRRSPLIICCLSLFVFFSIFNTVFYPENLEFWIALVPLLFLYLFLSLNSTWHQNLNVRIAAFSLVMSLTLTNALGSVIPQSREQGDFWRDINQFLIEETSQSDLILVRCGYVCNNYLKHGSEARILPVFSMPASELVKEIKQHQSGQIFISSFVFNPLSGFEASGNRLTRDQQQENLSLLEPLKGRLVSVNNTQGHITYRMPKNSFNKENP